MSRDVMTDCDGCDARIPEDAAYMRRDAGGTILFLCRWCDAKGVVERKDDAGNYDAGFIPGACLTEGT